jgi:hypothetical protein
MNTVLTAWRPFPCPELLWRKWLLVVWTTLEPRSGLQKTTLLAWFYSAEIVPNILEGHRELEKRRL